MAAKLYKTKLTSRSNKKYVCERLPSQLSTANIELINNFYLKKR